MLTYAQQTENKGKKREDRKGALPKQASVIDQFGFSALEGVKSAEVKPEAKTQILQPNAP